MANDIDALRAEVAALRAELAEQRPSPHVAHRAMSRRHLLSGLAAAGAAATVVGADPASAAAGDPLVLGETNVSATTTRLYDVDPPVDPVPGFPIDPGEPLLLLQDSGQGGALSALSIGDAIVAGGSIVGLRAWGGGYAILAESDGLAAVAATATGDAVGVAVFSENGTGVFVGSTSGAHLNLQPTTAPGPPAGIPAGEVGMLSLDAAGDLWVCVAAGNPGTWTRLLREDSAAGRTVPITPIRAIDTRAPGGRPTGAPAVPGQAQGPLHGGTDLTLDLAGVAPIPATATGVVGNLSVIAPSYTGHLAARPAGTTGITSNLNFPKGVAALSNAFTSQLGPAGLTIRGSGGSSNTYHLVVDITAYLT